MALSQKTFTPMGRDHQPLAPVTYYPLQVDIGGRTDPLALHKVGNGWQLSDPISGGRICDVHGSYKGVLTSTAGVGVMEARKLARDHVLRIAAHHGNDGFWRVVDTARMARHERAKVAA